MLQPKDMRDIYLSICRFAGGSFLLLFQREFFLIFLKKKSRLTGNSLSTWPYHHRSDAYILCSAERLPHKDCSICFASCFSFGKICRKSQGGVPYSLPGTLTCADEVVSDVKATEELRRSLYKKKPGRRQWNEFVWRCCIPVVCGISLLRLWLTLRLVLRRCHLDMVFYRRVWSLGRRSLYSLAVWAIATAENGVVA